MRLAPTATYGTATLSTDARTVTVPLRGAVATGVWTVEWQVTARDGDVMMGSYKFAVGPRTVALHSGQATSAKDASATAVLRWLLYAALALLLGELATRRLAPGVGLRRWAPAAAGAGTVTALALAALLARDGSLLGSRPGVLTLITAAGFAFAAVVVSVRRDAWAAVPLTAVLVAEALRAHPQTGHPVTGVLLTFVHLAAAALWVGTLVHVLRARSRPLLIAYARLAAWLFAAVVATGLVSALLLVPLGDLATTPYGQVLLAKLALVAAASALAVAARRRLRRRQTPRHPARMEAAALACVLALSATLTVLPTPAQANPPLPFAPPADGPVVPAGTRAGEIGISARASAGQLVVDLTAPATGERADEGYKLAATFADPRGRSRPLKLRGCGTGCFYAPAAWRDGTSRLTLAASAEGWTGGRAGLTITWPPRPAADLLREAVTAMKAAPGFTLHELVTSNTTLGLGNAMTLHTTGERFLASDPYGSGTAPVSTRLPDQDGHRRIALAYPAEHLQLTLTLDEGGRILHETLAGPNHLITRTFVYPEPTEDH